jgi:hypothetical protein
MGRHFNETRALMSVPQLLRGGEGEGAFQWNESSMLSVPQLLKW